MTAVEPNKSRTQVSPAAVLPARLALNLAPISFSADVLKVGRLPYEDEDQYRRLREDNRATHVFRFDGRTKTILNVGLGDSIAPLGEPETVKIEDVLLLLGKAVQQALFAWLAKRRTILRPAKPLVCLGNRKAALLLASIRELQLEPIEGLDVLVRHSFDTRVIQPARDGAAPTLMMLLEVSTSNEINLPVSELMAAGLDVRGAYVCRRNEGDDEIQPRLETLGRVAEISGSKLQLTDSVGADTVDASAVILEPRQENLERVVRLLYPRDGARILQGLAKRRRPYATAQGKFEQATQTLAGLRESLPLTFSGGLTATIAPLLSEGDPSFPAAITTGRPGLQFGPQGRETGQWPDAGISAFGPFKYALHERNEPVVAVVCEASQRGRTEQLLETLRSGFPDQVWQRANAGRSKFPENPFKGGLIGKFRLQRLRFEIETTTESTPDAYRRAITAVLQRLPKPPDMALVQTRASHWNVPPSENPYLVSKATFMSAGVPVQGIEAETMESSDRNLPYITNNLALGIYAKLGGTPFVMSTRAPATHELVVGLGYAEVSEGRLGPRSRYVGLTTVFQADGRYLVWGQTREVEFADYAQALLSNLSTTVRFVREQNNWQPGDRVRLIFHVYKPLKNQEIDSIKKLVRELTQDKHEVEFAFLDISKHHNFLFYDPNQEGVAYYAPGAGRGTKGMGVVARGQCRQLSARAALLQLVGPNELKTNAQGAPRPLLVELHPDSDFTDLTYLVRQIFHFSYLSWRSFFPSEEPVTILYSRLIAKALGNLRPMSGWRSDALTVGHLRNSMWFL